MEIIVPGFVPSGKKLGLGKSTKYQVGFHPTARQIVRQSMIAALMIGSSRGTRDSVLL